MLKPKRGAGVTAHKVDDAKTIFRDKIKYPYDHLDDAIKITSYRDIVVLSTWA